MSEAKYVIGIDLGTTNSAAAYSRVDVQPGEEPEIKVLEIPQITGPGTVEAKNILPSFIFLPEEHDVAKDALSLPWSYRRTSIDDKASIAVGEFARDRGAEIPNRLISSSKSWLCTPWVDRNGKILPNEGPEEGKLSPVEAGAAILRHIREAWDYTMASEDSSLMMENQDVLLTVPASFDAVARELTVQAAAAAGLPDVILLEEPQAAFYAWIHDMGNFWRKSAAKDDLVLVFDIGGGTTDYSLIRVDEEEGELVLERIAVGDHLLVGGDNMDLALAYSIARKLGEKGTRLDSWQMRGLWHSVRSAKEKILDGEAEKLAVTILGRGSSLIGGTIKAEITRQDIDQVVLEGFFPQCRSDEIPKQVAKTGLKEIGLAYEADPGVTRHLAKFLGDKIPTAVLFNGGVMKSEPARKRVLDTLESWAQEHGAEKAREIECADIDLAVAKGAAYYGLARRGGGVRIRGGLSRSYYLGVAASMPAVPGMPEPVKAICIGTFGMEEGTEQALPGQEYALVVGEEVKFDFLGSVTRLEDAFGAVVNDWEGEIEAITTIETTLDGDTGSVIPVTIEVKATEIGTLELWCVSKKSGKRWKLEFNVREKE